MSLFQQPLRPSNPMVDDAVARYIAAIRADLEPDPRFRRRLRGHLLNRFVAEREGLAATPRSRRRHMGRLGRAVLYASFALGISVTSVMAAAQQSVPGDLLYALKRQIESLRHEVLPAHLHDDLIAIELTERLEEYDQLTSSGRQDQAVALLSVIEADFAALTAYDAGSTGTIGQRMAVLDAILARLPDSAREAVEAAMHKAGAAPGRPGSDTGATNGGASGTNPGGTGAGGEPPEEVIPGGGDSGSGRGGTGGGGESGGGGGSGGAPEDPGSQGDPGGQGGEDPGSGSGEQPSDAPAATPDQGGQPIEPPKATPSAHAAP